MSGLYGHVSIAAFSLATDMSLERGPTSWWVLSCSIWAGFVLAQKGKLSRGDILHLLWGICSASFFLHFILHVEPGFKVRRLHSLLQSPRVWNQRPLYDRILSTDTAWSEDAQQELPKCSSRRAIATVYVLKRPPLELLRMADNE